MHGSLCWAQLLEHHPPPESRSHWAPNVHDIAAHVHPTTTQRRRVNTCGRSGQAGRYVPAGGSSEVGEVVVAAVAQQARAVIGGGDLGLLGRRLRLLAWLLGLPACIVELLARRLELLAHRMLQLMAGNLGLLAQCLGLLGSCLELLARRLGLLARRLGLLLAHEGAAARRGGALVLFDASRKGGELGTAGGWSGGLGETWVSSKLRSTICKCCTNNVADFPHAVLWLPMRNLVDGAAWGNALRICNAFNLLASVKDAALGNGFILQCAGNDR
jgi:hypothetical protein